MEQAMLMTAEESRKILRLGRSRFYSSVKANEIPGVIRFGRKILIRRAVLLHWLGSSEAGVVVQ